MSQPKVIRSEIDKDLVDAIYRSVCAIAPNPNAALVNMAAALYMMHKLNALPENQGTQFLVQVCDMIWKQIDQNSAANVGQGGNG